MTLIVNRVNAGDFLLNGVPVERGFINGALFWERKLEIWVSRFLPPGQTVWWGYFNVDDHVQAVAPGFQGDVICHVDCQVISTNVEYPVDAGPNAPYRGYRSFTIRVEPNGRVYGYGGAGGAGGVSGWDGGDGYPWYSGKSNGKVHYWSLKYGSLGGGMGSDGGGCINGRGIAIIQMPADWRSYVMAGGGGGGGGAKFVRQFWGQKVTCQPAGGGGGCGFNNAPGGGGHAPGAPGSSAGPGKGGTGTTFNGWQPAQPPNHGFGGYGTRVGENQTAGGNGGNGGSWNQSGGGGAMSNYTWSGWDSEWNYKGRDGNVVVNPTVRAEGAAPGSRGRGHDYRKEWADGGWGGHSGTPVAAPRAIQYY